MNQFIKFILEWHYTCFDRSFRPSSGIQDCTNSNRHLPNRYCCLLASKQTAVFDICLLLYVQSWTSDDGRKDRLKHVDYHSKINKLDTLVHLVGFTIEIILRCTALWTSDFSSCSDTNSQFAFCCFVYVVVCLCICVLLLGFFNLLRSVKPALELTEMNWIFSHTAMDRVYTVKDSKRDEPPSESMLLINNWQIQDSVCVCDYYIRNYKRPVRS